jgi:gamma-glutamyltranspeptidase/glutathione hydrolase
MISPFFAHRVRSLARSVHRAGVAGCALAFAVSMGSPPPLATPATLVAAADPLAVRAGLDILRRGGSAMDAAVAVQVMLGLVEPQSSGLGGGAFLLYWDAKAARLYSYDGRETAPASARPDMFLDVKGAPPANYMAAAIGGRSVGVPGVVALLGRAHDRHGKLAWNTLFDSTITLAESGFDMDPRIRAQAARIPDLDIDAKARAYLFEDDKDKLVPRRHLVNRAYAKTLRHLSANGPKSFYRGEIAAAMVEAVNRAPRHPGNMSLKDFSAYEVKERSPVCGFYRLYKICGMGPPSAGAVALLQILGLLEAFDLRTLTPSSLEAVHLVSEAERLAYADRDHYIADPDFVEVPMMALLSSSYLAERVRLIDRYKSMGVASAGQPQSTQSLRRSPDRSQPLPSTSHFTIMDGEGNVVSMTSSIEGPFGSHLMAGGFFLNNELTDFSLLPESKGKPVANAIAPFKRPRSAMAPVVIFDEKGELFAAFGSPGGSRIIAYVAQTVIALIDWQMPLQAAIELPRHANRNAATELEEGTALAELKASLEAMGHEVKLVSMTSGIYGIARRQASFEGGADPRRPGVALSLGGAP